MGTSEQFDLIRREAPRFSAAVCNASETARNEAEFITAVEKEINRVSEQIGIQLDFRKEYVLARGRADAVFNTFIIEYEPPKSLSNSLDHGHTKHAIGQVKRYIRDLSTAEGHEAERLSGVAFDGRYFIYVRFRDGTFHVEPPQEVNAQSSSRFLMTLFLAPSERAFIPENLVADFGGKSDTAKRAIGALYMALDIPTPLTERLYGQWKLFFSEVAGYQAAEGNLEHKQELNTLAKASGIEPAELDVPRFLFALHTYFSSLVKLIARAALESVRPGDLDATPLSSMEGLEGESLIRELRHIEDGGFFLTLGIRNLLEGDFFGWYLESFSAEIEDSFKEILLRLSDYSPATLQADPFATRDLLKALYHRLLPRPIRHDLGEFYTPDWLAERVLIQLGEPLYYVSNEGSVQYSDPNKRLLDPACGSGTFLILALRALKDNLRRTGMSDDNILELALRNVVGVDLNPLAVLAARVNYVLALLDLLPLRKGEIEIPVYLADSILTPERGDNLLNEDRLTLKTVVGDLAVPATVDSPEELAKLTSLLEDSVKDGFEPEVFVEAASRDIRPAPGPNEKVILRELYEKLLELHQQGLNGIWPRIIKNAFVPLFLKNFDYVVGNPPWINWETLPEDYRRDVAPLWQDYGLFRLTDLSPNI